MLVEELEPVLRLLLGPLQAGLLRRVGRALVVGEDLRVDEAVAVLAVELGVQPVHHLVDFGALLEVLRIGGRAHFVCEVLQDRRGFGQAEALVFQHRHLSVGIDGGEGRLVVVTLHQVDGYFLDRDVVLGDEQPNRTAGHRDRMHVELHGLPPCRPDYTRSERPMARALPALDSE
ncbi:MAG TPA: hypothetical protein VNU96_00595 [Burkholderiales bacterium]|nr:hypothetical protein [Burkholderiales bacterium]